MAVEKFPWVFLLLWMPQVRGVWGEECFINYPKLNFLFICGSLV